MSDGESKMGAWEILDGLHVERRRSQREAAARALLVLLTQLAGGTLSLPGTPPRSWNIPRGRQEEAVDAVVERVIKKTPLPVVAEIREDLAHRDRRCTGYLRKMILNWWLDQIDRDWRVNDFEEDLAPVAPPEEALLDAHRPLLERVCAAAVEARPAQYREVLRKTWRQIWELVTHTRSMTTTLAEDEGAPPGDVTAARNRLYKRSQRLREYMLGAADAMRAEGSLEPDDHRVVASFIVGVMVRCQTSAAPGVSRAHDPSNPATPATSA